MLKSGYHCSIERIYRLLMCSGFELDSWVMIVECVFNKNCQNYFSLCDQAMKMSLMRDLFGISVLICVVHVIQDGWSWVMEVAHYMVNVNPPLFQTTIASTLHPTKRHFKVPSILV